MATITAATDEKVFRIAQFLGLNENPDGDTKLKFGEAVQCKNWCVTRDKNLRRRYGSKYVISFPSATKIAGMWSGYLNGKEEFIVATNGHLYRIWDEDNSEWIIEQIGTLDTSDRVTFFPFDGKIYMLNGVEYYCWDGRAFGRVKGYRPLIAISRAPSGAQSSLLEEINKLNGARRIWFSPDGTSTVFQLIDKDIASVDYVMKTSDGTLYDNDDYTIDLANGTVTFDTAPTAGTNTIEIAYTVPLNYRSQVIGMKYFELYSGANDTRVFIYGDGSNQCFYSSLDYDGRPRADYFPDLNVMGVGTANTPVTGLIRHYSSLIAYKTDGAYAITYGTIELADGNTEAAFYVKTINKTIGNIASGQVCLILNSPRTLHGNDMYEWHNTSRYSQSLTADERQAQRMSDRIYYTLSQFDLKNAYCYDDNDNQEYYIVNPSTKEALIHNYVADAWYYYDHFDMQCAVNFQGYLFTGSSDGKINKHSDEWYADNDVAFSSYWESGSIDFGKPYEFKYSSMMWLGIKPDSRGKVYVTLQTDRKSNFSMKSTESFLLDFGDIDFANFSFDTDRSPKIHRHKMKAKKFVYYKAILQSDDVATTATVLDLSFRIRFIGYAK